MKTLLVIDEDGDVAWTVSAAVAGSGYLVERRGEVDGALDAIRALAPDLVVVDVIFADDPSAGFALARRIRQQPDLRDIPMLLLAAPEELAELGFRFQASDIRSGWLAVEAFVPKPCGPDLLRPQLERFL